MDVEMNRKGEIQLYLDDLKEGVAKDITKVLGDNQDFDIFPVATIPTDTNGEY